MKLSVNETLESVANRFVDITKAYKSCVTFLFIELLSCAIFGDSLTDETIRKNWELYGHPDGRQEISMGIALPHWIIEGKNNIWVLGFYALMFGAALPLMVVRLPQDSVDLLGLSRLRAVGGSAAVRKLKTV